MNTDFKTFWASLTADEKRELAKKADTSVAYLSQIATGHRGPGRKTIASLVEAHEGISLAMFFDAA